METTRETLDARRVVIRTIYRPDANAILQIERDSFEFPWTASDFIRCLGRDYTIGVVADCGGDVAGFVIFELLSQQIRLLNIAVDQRFRRRGIGRLLVDRVIGMLSGLHQRRLVLEVRESNLTGQIFFRSCGFKAVAVLHDFYDDTPEDAYRMVYRIGRVGCGGSGECCGK